MNERATLIKARWVVGFDGREHRLIENGCVAYAGDKILHVGTAWDGEASETIEAPEHLVIPGLISTHAHIGAGLGDRHRVSDRAGAQLDAGAVASPS